MARRRIHAVGIDLQNDFCCTPTNTPGEYEGTLAVPGARNSCDRFAALIRRNIDRITGMSFTLDCHHAFHIGNHTFWVNSKGEVLPMYAPVLC